MQVSVAQPPIPQSQLALQQRQDSPLAAGAPPTVANEPASPPIQPEGDSVSLRNAGDIESLEQAQASSAPAAVVFAEIWKDGAKVGSVYTDGHAELPLTSQATVGSGHSATAPYIRAQEISRALGGEVHFVDLGALQVAQTRKQLRSLYGV